MTVKKLPATPYVTGYTYQVGSFLAHDFKLGISTSGTDTRFQGLLTVWKINGWWRNHQAADRDLVIDNSRLVKIFPSNQAIKWEGHDKNLSKSTSFSSCTRFSSFCNSAEYQLSSWHKVTYTHESRFQRVNNKSVAWLDFYLIIWDDFTFNGYYCNINGCYCNINIELHKGTCFLIVNIWLWSVITKHWIITVGV